MFRPRPDGRIPVIAGPRLIEFAGPARIAVLARAPNAKVIRRHKDKAIIGILLAEWGDDSRRRSGDSRPLVLSHRAETAENPRRCWTLKKLVDVTGPGT